MAPIHQPNIRQRKQGSAISRSSQMAAHSTDHGVGVLRAEGVTVSMGAFRP